MEGWQYSWFDKLTMSGNKPAHHEPERIGASGGGSQTRRSLDLFDVVERSCEDEPIARTQHMLRLDYDGQALPEEALSRLREAAVARLEGVKAVLVSDYAKGVLSGDLGRALNKVLSGVSAKIKVYDPWMPASILMS